MSYLGPIVTLSLGVAGLLVWRVQLVGKRRAELAEETLLACILASDAVSFLRDPVVWPHEQDALRQEGQAPSNKKLQNEEFMVVFHRYKQEEETFANLRRIQILCRYNFGSNIEAAVDEIRATVKIVLHAAHMGLKTQYNDLNHNDERALWREWRDTIREGASKPDKILELINNARSLLENELSKHLRRGKALMPLRSFWQAIKAKFPIFTSWFHGKSSNER